MRTGKKTSRSGRVSKINLSHAGMIIESDRSHGRTSLIQAGLFILVTVCWYVRGYYEFLLVSMILLTKADRHAQRRNTYPLGSRTR